MVEQFFEYLYGFNPVLAIVLTVLGAVTVATITLYRSINKKLREVQTDIKQLEEKVNKISVQVAWLAGVVSELGNVIRGQAAPKKQPGPWAEDGTGPMTFEVRETPADREVSGVSEPPAGSASPEAPADPASPEPPAGSASPPDPEKPEQPG